MDAIVSAAGDAAAGSIDQLTDEQVQFSVNSKLQGQINVVRKGLPYLRPNGVFVITGGFLAYKPAPQTAMYAVANSGLEGFAKTAAVELTEGRRIVIVHPPWVANGKSVRYGSCAVAECGEDSRSIPGCYKK